VASDAVEEEWSRELLTRMDGFAVKCSRGIAPPELRSILAEIRRVLRHCMTIDYKSSRIKNHSHCNPFYISLLVGTLHNSS